MSGKSQAPKPVALPFVVATKGAKPDQYHVLDISGGVLKAAAERKHAADQAAKEAREAFEMAAAAVAHKAGKLPEDVGPAVYWSRFTGEAQLGLDAQGRVLVRKLSKDAAAPKAAKATISL